MIGRLSGTVVDLATPWMILDVHGTGYELYCSRECLSGAKLGESLTVTVYTDVKEDSIRLYGFTDKLEGLL